MPASSLQFPKKVRLLNGKDYQRVFKDPIRSSDPLFTILASQNNTKLPRLGLAIAKKTIPRAVDRNRIKRQVRESFRINQTTLQGVDFVVLAKKGLQDKGNDEIQHSLGKHWQRLMRRCAES